MRTILAIDDKENNLITITGLIDCYMPDCKVLTATSAEEGISIAQIEQPDTILLDVIMPEMDGFEACKRLKKDDLTKHIPIVLITAVKIDVESRTKGLNIGADAFLSKPIDTSEFVAQVNVMLRIKEAEDKLRAENIVLEELIEKRTAEISKKNLKLQIEITERKIAKQKRAKAERALNESEKNLRTLFNSMTDIVFEVNYDGRLVNIAPTSTKLLFKEPEKLIGNKLHDIFPKAEADKFLKFCRKCLDKNKAYNLDYSLLINNQKTWFEGRGIPKTQNTILFIARDISERKKAEQIQKILHNISNAVISSINIEKLIYIIKEELGTIIDTQNYYITLYDDETNSFALPFLADEKDRSQSYSATNTMAGYVVNSRKTLFATENQQKKLVEQGKFKFIGSRSKVWLGIPLFMNDKVIGVVVVQSYTSEKAYTKSDVEILEFISGQISISIDRKQREQDLIFALKKATESDRLKSSFLSTMSHELRTPLNSIIGFSEFITEELTVAEIIEFVKTINDSGRHLLSIVEDIFDITIIETGEVKILKQDVQLQSVLNDILQIMKIEQQKMKKSNLDLELLISPNEKNLLVKIDSSKLKQIIINILKNALKFTSEGHIQFGFSLMPDVNKPMLKFYIKDTGIGIPLEKHDFIFNVFRQVDDSDTRAFGGAGLGLSIAKKLIELLGGEIWLESDVGIGSVFYFTVPYEVAEFVKHTEKSEINYPPINKTNKIAEKNILIVEDDTSSYKFLKLLMEKFGYKTLWAENGKLAVEICKKNQDIDLVLMDINMPIMDGFEATKEIKKLNPNLPIIAQTAYAMDGDKDKILKAGCDEYISKPIRRELLFEKIEKLLKLNEVAVL